MNKIIRAIITICIIICACLFGSMKVSAAEPSLQHGLFIDITQVTDFMTNGGCLMLYFNDGTGYYWEKEIDASIDIVSETVSDEHIQYNSSIVDMDAVVDFSATEYGLQLYFEDGSGYYLER